jgi:hypothetical protein
MNLPVVDAVNLILVTMFVIFYHRMTNHSGNQLDESIEEKIALGVRLIRCAWYMCTPVIFLVLTFLFGNKGDITIPFFASAGISIILFLIVDSFLKLKVTLLYDRMGKSLPENYR